MVAADVLVHFHPQATQEGRRLVAPLAVELRVIALLLDDHPRPVGDDGLAGALDDLELAPLLRIPQNRYYFNKTEIDKLQQSNYDLLKIKYIQKTKNKPKNEKQPDSN